MSKVQKLIEVENLTGVIEGVIATHLKSFLSIYTLGRDKARWFAKNEGYSELASIDPIERDAALHFVLASSFVSACKKQGEITGDDAYRAHCTNLLNGIYPDVDFASFYAAQEWIWEEPLKHGTAAIGAGKTLQLAFVAIIGLVMGWLFMSR